MAPSPDQPLWAEFDSPPDRVCVGLTVASVVPITLNGLLPKAEAFSEALLANSGVLGADP